MTITDAVIKVLEEPVKGLFGKIKTPAKGEISKCARGIFPLSFSLNVK